MRLCDVQMFNVFVYNVHKHVLITIMAMVEYQENALKLSLVLDKNRLESLKLLEHGFGKLAVINNLGLSSSSAVCNDIFCQFRSR